MLTEEERRRGGRGHPARGARAEAIPQLSRTFPTMEIEDAYRVQDLWADARIAKGARMVGHKIGLTSRAMQMASKMTEPDYGRILDDALYNDGAQIRADAFLKPRLEVELAFVMGEDLEGPGARIYDVMRATEFVVPALEIIDYRTEVPRAIIDTIADNAAFGGDRRRRAHHPADGCRHPLGRRNLVEERHHRGVRRLGRHHGPPAAGIAWLVNKLHAVDAKLKRGQIVLAGSFTRPVDIAAGDVIHADYGPLGAIGVSFV